MFSPIFNALSKEAQFAFEILGSGVTQIRKANYAKKGVYYEAFTNLSVGLERLGKLCLLLDYYIEHDGNFPDFKYLKQEIGHDITKLYDKSILIKEKYSFHFHFMNYIDHTIHQNILKILSNFAITDRYENLNFLVTSEQKNNPISLWFKNVDMLIFDQRVTQRKKQLIYHNAEFAHKMMSRFTVVAHSDESGNEINEVFEASLRTGIYDAVKGYRQIYVIHIIRFWTELLRELQGKASIIGREDIPFFSDMFGSFYNHDSYLRTRKNFDNG